MSKHLLLFLALAAFAAPELLLKAQQQPAANPPPQVSPGILRGIVVRAGTSEPIRDVQIAVGSGAANAQALQSAAQIEQGKDSRDATGGAAARLLETVAASLVQPNSKKDFYALSDSNGRFTIEGIPPGQYPLTAQREGYFSPGNASPPTIARTTTRVTALRTTDVTIEMVPAASVSGRIFDPSGAPVVQVPVEILRRAYIDGAPTAEK